MFTVTIKVDVNDGDYHSDSITMDDDQFAKFTGIIGKIRHLFDGRFNPRIEEYDYTDFNNYYGQVLSEDELKILEDVIPVPDPGYATLEEVSFITGKPTKLL